MIETDDPRPVSHTAPPLPGEKGSGVFFRSGPPGASPEGLPTPFPRPPAGRGSPEQQWQAKCAITVDQPTRVEVEATLPRAGFLVLNDAFAEGWTCECQSGSGHRSRLPVWCANRVMRCVALPAGQHQLVFRYRPYGVIWGGLISGLCWLGLSGCLLWKRLFQQRVPRQTV